ncbi:MAG TPA: AtpZ/AtpI family protein [Kiritimatiellia bacterium]|nr:AtpZ/AtpI family protein [Kiritimatiellia bacterium]
MDRPTDVQHLHRDKPGPGGPTVGVPSRAAFLGSYMAAAVGLFAVIGWYVGGRSGHAHGGALVGVFLGLISSLYELWKIVREVQRADRVSGAEEKG